MCTDLVLQIQYSMYIKCENRITSEKCELKSTFSVILRTQESLNMSIYKLNKKKFVIWVWAQAIVIQGMQRIIQLVIFYMKHHAVQIEIQE